MMNNKGVFEIEGVVTENLPNTMFRVKMTSDTPPDLKDKIVLCHLSGRMRRHFVRLLPGDRVRCEMTPLDTSLGRIVYRLK
ncbi:MAG: Translation initiation factor IF-1 [Candidatus Amesbacteria bacterium GW2011_GWC1_47_15]|uniref:Translation initiation factor IF-1 n=2 Tax=Microgenomates group TaxID=1794810 RepID=A0A0H4SZX3_9BACT|nr:translation initiation factor IF-1, translation initiation factor IF-1 [uncultured Microgenomates bacterium Rifle_16ft_4_minimus_1180]KKU62358.1 MAG: Translation initiation factor IF-1 [Candidatus Amesbacteria bacterium GW2011_GWC1_47_15]